MAGELHISDLGSNSDTLTIDNCCCFATNGDLDLWAAFGGQNNAGTTGAVTILPMMITAMMTQQLNEKDMLCAVCCLRLMSAVCFCFCFCFCFCVCFCFGFGFGFGFGFDFDFDIGFWLCFSFSF